MRSHAAFMVEASRRWCRTIGAVVLVGCGVTGLVASCGVFTESIDAQRTNSSGGYSVSPVVDEAQRTMIVAERAVNVFIGRCMTEAGFKYHGYTGTDVERTAGDLLERFSSETAAVDGYGVYIAPAIDDRPVDRARQQGVDYLNGLADDERGEYLRAFEGGGDDTAVTVAGVVGIGMEGCLGEARRLFFGDQVLDVFDVFMRLQGIQFLDSTGSAVVVLAEEEWSQCMLEGDYQFDTHQEAVARGMDLRDDLAEPTSEEVALAVTDAECRDRAGLVQAAAEAFDSENETVLAENEDLLNRWSQLESHVQQRAEEVLGENLF